MGHGKWWPRWEKEEQLSMVMKNKMFVYYGEIVLDL